MNIHRYRILNKNEYGDKRESAKKKLFIKLQRTLLQPTLRSQDQIENSNANDSFYQSDCCAKASRKKDRWKGQFSPADTSRSKHLCMTAHTLLENFFIYISKRLSAEQAFQQISYAAHHRTVTQVAVLIREDKK